MRGPKMKKLLLAITAVFVLSSISHAENYTLYRTSHVKVDQNQKLHVAVFDAPELWEDHNKDNCDSVRDLLMEHKHVEVRYWCEVNKGDN
jgi:hypothetical protein